MKDVVSVLKICEGAGEVSQGSGNDDSTLSGRDEREADGAEEAGGHAALFPISCCSRPVGMLTAVPS